MCRSSLAPLQKPGYVSRGCDGRVASGLCQDVISGGSIVKSLMGVKLTRRTFDEGGLGPMGNGTELLGYKTKGKTRLST